MKKVRPRRKFSFTRLAATIITIVIIVGMIGALCGVGVLASMLKDKPDMDITRFENPESSIIYDSNNEVVSELGMTIRQNISFDELPSVLVDAFVAVEDSRYFEHNGFDVPRFTKAILSNLKTLSFSQGGSTFTMQLVKNTYFVDDEAGKEASRSGLDGVRRKVQEIALAIELEGITNKKVIFENYLNKLNFGGSNNIRGVQKAAEYYYGKDVSELNLAESALLAGVINGPFRYNPFRNLELATQRRNEVLYLMNYHGYISDTDYDLAKSIKVEDTLVDISSHKGSGQGIPYQAYIDTVISEVYDLTGLDPYTTPMRIYTYMDRELQEVMDDIQAENVEGYFEYPDEEFEVASISINNRTGAINGVLGGRNYSNGGALLLNHATDQFKQPGSSIKPILDYVLAFENLGWSTSHVVLDKPITYPGTSIIIANANGAYQGQVTLKDAVGNSLNTPAIQALQQVIDAKSSSYVVDYLNSMGFNVSLDTFNVQFGIGGGEFAVSCEQMAAAQGALINGGQYIKPHTIARIEFLEGKSPVNPVYTASQTVSPEASYLVSQLLYNNVYGSYSNLMQILRDDYAIYAKTGTTDWGSSGRPYNIPTGAIKDSWMVASTTDYTVATWIGYERAYADKPSYITMNAYLQNIQGRVTNMISDMNVQLHGQPQQMLKPDGVVSISHILGTYPYASPIEGMDEKYITSGLIKKEYASVVSPESVEVEAMTSDPSVSVNSGTIDIKWPEYKDADKMKVADEQIDISLKRSDGTVILEKSGHRLFDYSWVYGPVRYKAEIRINGERYGDVIKSENNEYKIENVPVNPGDTIEVLCYYGYENKDIDSNKIPVTFKVQDGVIKNPTLPQKESELASWFAENKIPVCTNIVYNKTNDPSLDGFIEKYVGPSYDISTGMVKDGTETSYAAGSHYGVYQSQASKAAFTRIEVYSYSETLTISKNSNSSRAGDVIQFIANTNSTSPNIYWSCFGPAIINENGLLTIDNDAESGSEITVTARLDSGKTESVTITVE